jgi:hypothetical protein
MFICLHAVAKVMNLNDAVEGNCESDLNDFDVVMDLSAEVKREYDGDSDAWCDLYVGIGNLTLETAKYRQGKIRLVTRVEGTDEILEIYSGGQPLPPNKVLELNRHYQEGRRLLEKPTIGGSRIAAFYLSKVHGTISIENCDLAPYTLKNSVVFK